MSWVDGRLLGFDMETTEADPMTAVPCSYAFVYRRDERRMSIETKLIDPEVEIPEEATAIHGITTERARAEGLPLSDALCAITERLYWAEEQAIPLVTMNGSYDLTIINRLAGLADWHGTVLDVFVLDKVAHRYRKGSRRLGALAEYHGVEAPLDEHSSAGDAITSVLVLLAMAEKWPWLRRVSAEKLHDYQLRWADQQTENLSAHFVEQGKAPLGAEEYGWPIKRVALEDEGC